MDDLSFQPAQRDDFPELAAWLVGMSQAPQRHCLHTWSGQSPEDLAQQLLAYWQDSELSYVMARQGGRLAGAMGCEFDRALEHGWLHGPHADPDDWEHTADALFDRLMTTLPAEIRCLDTYLNVENTRARRFYTRHGFAERETLNHDFWLTPDRRVASDDPGCELLSRKHEPSFKTLFEAEFPAAYYSAQRVIDMIGASHQVLVLAEGEQVLGFAVVSVEGDRSSGELQFFAVREDHRRRGFGRRLLLAAIDWSFDQAGVRGISLNVGEELVHARGLYESVGFRLRYSGIGLSSRSRTGA